MLYSEEQIDDAVADVLLATQRMRTSAFGLLLYVYLQIMKLMFAFDSVGKQMEIFLLKPQVAMHIRMLVCYHHTNSGKNASDYPCPGVPPRRSFILQPCSSDNLGHGTVKFIGLNTKASILMMPPLDAGEKFGEIYDVVLILDDREHFTRSKNGSRSKKFMESIETEFKIQIEVRRLEVGDGLWIAKHKYTGSEYVLDFIVERKHVDDLFSSIKDSRYRDQKLRLTGCGLQRLIYIVEGDPNSHEAGETIKTACFTTEILEGFDVQRTSGLGDTLRKYGYLTHAITNYYGAHITNDEMRNTRICPSYKDFLKKCQDIDKMTVSDVFAVQLMQVSQVTEEIALSVLELYPTLLSLARAYSLLLSLSGINSSFDFLWKCCYQSKYVPAISELPIHPRTHVNLARETMKELVEAMMFVLSSQFWRMAVLWTFSIIFSYLQLWWKSQSFPRLSPNIKTESDGRLQRPVCVITGATSGLGAAAAYALSREGFYVVLAGRSTHLLSEMVKEIKQRHPDAHLKAIQVDIASFQSMLRFKRSLELWLLGSDMHPSVQLLINNAGMLATSYRFTAEGYEQMMGTNYIGTFLLANLLLPLLKNSYVPSRIVNVTSFTHRCVSSIQLDEETLTGKYCSNPKQYQCAQVYEHSKLYLLLFSYELHRQLNRVDKSNQVSIMAADPGVVETNIMKEIPSYLSLLSLKVLKLLGLLQDPDYGVHSIIDAALAPLETSGKYFFGGRGRTIRSSVVSYDTKLSEELWTISSKLFLQLKLEFKEDSS
ncbi:hypothetical protein GIB67_019800 [Kingdonia uniflora]|uniref:Crossover junction endonuclease MUS81 n=1 Tax=Kingdonia uniflora TaxID=39325 RepID=A0A7J7MKE4_9MAGN|nr:hypothetical protein GIB67_019800 [Kingdonia uniflora]